MSRSRLLIGLPASLDALGRPLSPPAVRATSHSFSSRLENRTRLRRRYC
jgi:hypothetical protein